MKRILFFCAVLLFASVFLKTARSLAYTPSSIDNCPGELVVDATHKVINDVAPRAVGTGVWAFKNYERRLRVWKSSPYINVYCAKAEDNGLFITLDGPSPQGTDPKIAGGIAGRFEGGYRTNYFFGTLNPIPDEPRWGPLGNIDYDCKSADPGDHSSCTRSWDWQKIYFNSIRYQDPLPGHEYIWWGWSYASDNIGIWLNICGGRAPLCPGNSGDIVDG